VYVPGSEECTLRVTDLGTCEETEQPLDLECSVMRGLQASPDGSQAAVAYESSFSRPLHLPDVRLAVINLPDGSVGQDHCLATTSTAAPEVVRRTPNPPTTKAWRETTLPHCAWRWKVSPCPSATWSWRGSPPADTLRHRPRPPHPTVPSHMPIKDAKKTPAHPSTARPSAVEQNDTSAPGSSDHQYRTTRREIGSHAFRSRDGARACAVSSGTTAGGGMQPAPRLRRVRALPRRRSGRPCRPR
jgi:hypothetical protein